jgi:hypothetical protein
MSESATYKATFNASKNDYLKEIDKDENVPPHQVLNMII